MRKLLILVLSFHLATAFSQDKINPVIKSFGGIYDVPEASVKPDPNIEYKIVIDVYGGAVEDKSQTDGSLNNVARMINLHAVGGVSPENIKVVLAIHGKSTYSILTDKAFKERFGIDNPNTLLLKELNDSGVIITVCGQSLLGREIAINEINPLAEVAVSMLTTVSTYQMKGYGLLKF